MLIPTTGNQQPIQEKRNCKSLTIGKYQRKIQQQVTLNGIQLICEQKILPVQPN